MWTNEVADCSIRCRLNKRSSVKSHICCCCLLKGRTQADVRFPAASSDSSCQRCLFIGDKIKFFTHHLHPSFVCALSHLLNYKVFQSREMKGSGVFLGMKSMSEWIYAHSLLHNPRKRSLPISTGQEKLEECEPSFFFSEVIRDCLED